MPLSLIHIYLGDAVDHSGNAEGVVVATPLLSRYRETGGDSAVDVGEFIGLDIAIGEAGTGEKADIGQELLLEVHADAAAALVLPHGRDIGGAAGDLSLIHI